MIMICTILEKIGVISNIRIPSSDEVELKKIEVSEKEIMEQTRALT